MMGIHSWHRVIYTIPAHTDALGEELPECTVWENRDTEGLEPPEGDGWTLCSAFGVSAVPGAGGSPARPAKRRPATT